MFALPFSVRIVLRASLLFCCLAAWSTAGAVAADPADAKFADERQALSTGVELEKSRKWLEAVEFYESTLKDWPASESLQKALRRSKGQFSIERRYADQSFLAELVSLPSGEALAHLDELMMSVRQRYVDPISSTSLLAHGTESLYLALSNEKFLQNNLPRATPEQTRRVRSTLVEHYWNKSVTSPEAGRQLVSEVCELSRRELGLNATPVIMEYVFGACNALDEYSSYLTPGRRRDLFDNIAGEFVGIGVEMKGDMGKGLRLMNVLPESPAAEGGCLNGDFITAVDGIDCRNMSIDEAASILQGQAGSQVRLQLTSPAGEVRETTLVRRAVKVKSIPVAKIVDPVNGVGYIKMTGFQKNTTEELDAALFKLHREGMRALIWDLRGNPGGLLDVAVEVLDRFIAEGVLVSTRGRTSDSNSSYSARREGTWSMPLVVLLDGDSASASEIVAGAIHDHHRGELVGRKTYGKWSVQTIHMGRGDTGLRLTTAKFYSPSGHTYGKVGFQPDVVVPEPTSQTSTAYRGQLDPSADPDIEAGLNALKKQLARR